MSPDGDHCSNFLSKSEPPTIAVTVTATPMSGTKPRLQQDQDQEPRRHSASTAEAATSPNLSSSKAEQRRDRFLIWLLHLKSTLTANDQSLAPDNKETRLAETKLIVIVVSGIPRLQNTSPSRINIVEYKNKILYVNCFNDAWSKATLVGKWK